MAHVTAENDHVTLDRMTDPTSPDTAPSATTGAAPAAATRRRWWLVLVGVVAAIVVGNLTILAAFGVARAG